MINSGFPGYVAPSKNQWDNDYPSGGNYWSNYRQKYPNAQELADTGLADTPYVISDDNQDRYPLLNPVDIAQISIPEITPCTALAIIGLIGILVAAVTFMKRRNNSAWVAST